VPLVHRRAVVLVAEMPHTLAALERGVISEWRATLLARETLFLSREHRERIDTQLCADPSVLDGWGDRRLTAEIQQLAYQLDPVGYTTRRGTAESERRVTSRPAPDTMARVSALLPVAQGVAVYAALRQAADAAIAAGDGRSRGQLMADLLVQRVTGQATATGVPVEIHLVMSSCALLGAGDGADGDRPAHLAGHGPIPADLARTPAQRRADELAARQFERAAAADSDVAGVCKGAGGGEVKRVLTERVQSIRAGIHNAARQRLTPLAQIFRPPPGQKCPPYDFATEHLRLPFGCAIHLGVDGFVECSSDVMPVSRPGLVCRLRAWRHGYHR
jgi:hypothetical protein